MSVPVVVDGRDLIRLLYQDRLPVVLIDSGGTTSPLSGSTSSNPLIPDFFFNWHLPLSSNGRESVAEILTGYREAVEIPLSVGRSLTLFPYHLAVIDYLSEIWLAKKSPALGGAAVSARRA